jgi:hypothetical protein
VPEDPALVQRDPSVITFWLSHQVDPDHLPESQVVIAFDIGGPDQHQWLVLERGVPPSICIEDPNLGQDRYVYVEAGASNLYPVSRGLRSWRRALANGSIRLYGEPKLVKAFPDWFRYGGPETPAGKESATRT